MKTEVKNLGFSGYGGSTPAMRETADKIVQAISKADIDQVWMVSTQFYISGFTVTAGRKLKSGGAKIRLAVDVSDRSEWTRTPDDSEKTADIYVHKGCPETFGLAETIRNILIDQKYKAGRVKSGLDIRDFFGDHEKEVELDADGNIV